MNRTQWIEENVPDQSGRVAVVTGANGGIGYEAARGLVQAGATVLLACRSKERGEAAMERVNSEGFPGEARFLSLDLSRLDSVRSFAKEVAETVPQLDILINNAGVMTPPLTRTDDGFELQMGVNHFGHFALTGLLMPLLRDTDGARIVTVSSATHKAGNLVLEDVNWEQRPYKPWAAYAQSKLANLLFALELQRRLDLAEAHVVSTASHPGWTATNITGHLGIDWLAQVSGKVLAMPTWKGAFTTLNAATTPAATAGRFFGPRGLWEIWGTPTEVQPAENARDPQVAKQLWKISEKLTGVEYGI